ncbi:MAG TPA: Gfo/Idh/MocA family oxidoreductase [Chthoniobacterales bacterium]|jgi:predicted dehydrogenase|nr:Gfo/Idh/MocA family oxidoreductase [Chthoniobacterales bacterium]
MVTRRTLAVGLIGYNFMGRAHSNAWRQAPRFFNLPVNLRLKTICGRNRAAVKKAAKKLCWENAQTDWRRVIDDSEIDVVDICTPNDTHCEIAVAAAQAGKAILCEKPLARNIDEAERMVRAVKKAGVVNMVCHNYRRIPAIVLAKRMIERGDLGERIFHFRAGYAQDWIVDPSFPLVWRLQSNVAGSGALGDIFSHIVDLARYLAGEFKDVCAVMETFVRQRPLEKNRRVKGKVAVDDAVTMIGRLKNGALASLEATRFAPGRKNSLTLEINGNAGSLFFDLEEMNRLRFFNVRDPQDRQGFRDILVTEPTHPYMDKWWPPGHIIGYEHSFTHTIADFVKAVAGGKNVQPTFADGLHNQCVLDAAKESGRINKWIHL